MISQHEILDLTFLSFITCAEMKDKQNYKSLFLGIVHIQWGETRRGYV